MMIQTSPMPSLLLAAFREPLLFSCRAPPPAAASPAGGRAHATPPPAAPLPKSCGRHRALSRLAACRVGPAQSWPRLQVLWLPDTPEAAAEPAGAPNAKPLYALVLNAGAAERLLRAAAVRGLSSSSSVVKRAVSAIMDAIHVC
jgi:hypothetical protein